MLPAPTASVIHAATADRQAFAARWDGWVRGLGIIATGPLTVLGDGAAWIWSVAANYLPAGEQVLDIFHDSQHLAAAAAGMLGDEMAAAGEWLDRARGRLLADG